jgi:hypothetical protein
MNGQISKNELNIKNLYQKAKENNKKFLYYPHSKSKLNTIIRKNKLHDLVVSYLWQSDLYKKELTKHQDLSKEIRQDIIDNVLMNAQTTPWPSVFRNFLKLHNPTDDEITELFTRKTASDDVKSNIYLECWELRTQQCSEMINISDTFYPIMNDLYSYRSTYVVRRIHSICKTILTDVPSLRVDLIEEISKISIKTITLEILQPIFKSMKVSDELVNLLLRYIDRDIFKDIMQNPIAKNNISDTMLAKILLTVD